jgi:glucose-1-phosphate thymidylyltransferase
MWGIVPAAGRGTRIQPLAFSKELLPVGSRTVGGIERPRAVSEHLLERMVIAGVDKICFVIGPGKTDILRYYGAGFRGARAAYVVQPEPSGLCDAVFRAAPLIDPAETVVIGLPDTIWFPMDALAGLDPGRFTCLLFPVDRPELFDSVVLDERDAVQRIDVKSPSAASSWIWGAMTMPGVAYHALHALWLSRNPHDEYIGTLINAFIAHGGEVWGTRAGRTYIDVGTVDGYRRASVALSRPFDGAGPEEKARA